MTSRTDLYRFSPRLSARLSPKSARNRPFQGGARQAETQAITAALRAEREAQAAERVTAALIELFADADPYRLDPADFLIDAGDDAGGRSAAGESAYVAVREAIAKYRNEPDELVARLQAQYIAGLNVPIAVKRHILQRALAIGQRTQGLDHQRTVWTLFLLAKAYYEEGRSDLAEPYLRKAIANWRSAEGESNLQPIDLGLDVLAGILIEKGRNDEAEICLREAVSLCRAAGNLESLAVRLQHLAQLVRRNNRLDEAEQLLREAADLLRQLFPPHDHRRLTVDQELAEVLRANQQYESGEALLRAALSHWLHASNRHQPGRLEALVNLSRNLTAQNRLDEAEVAARQAVEFGTFLPTGYRYKRLPLDEALFDVLAAQHKWEEGDNLAGRIFASRWDWAFGEELALAGIGKLAIDRLSAGELDEYRAECRELFTRYRDTNSARVAFSVAATCCLADWGDAPLQHLVALVDWAIAIAPDFSQLSIVRGAALYRAGEFEMAVEALTPIVEAGQHTHRGTAYERLFLALALARLDRHTEARKYYGSATLWLEQNQAIQIESPSAQTVSPLADKQAQPLATASSGYWRSLQLLRDEASRIVN